MNSSYTRETDDERQPLLGSTVDHSLVDLEMKTPSLFSRRRFLELVDPRRGDIALLACCFVTGALDTSLYQNYGVFVGMQTGNTILLTLASAGYPHAEPLSWATTLVSLGSFFVGAALTARVSDSFQALRRIVLTSNFLFQSACILAGAILITTGTVPTNNREEYPGVEFDPLILAVIPALGFQSGSTIATSRLLGYGSEIPVNVLTSTYTALSTDRNLFKRHNVARDRRLAAVFCVFVGALCATWVMARGPGIVLILWLCAAIKLLIAVGVFVFLKAEEKASGESEVGNSGS